jgi:hypothetical protein
MYLYLFTVAKQRLAKNVTAAPNTLNKDIAGCFVFYYFRVVAKENVRLVFPRNILYIVVSGK